MKVLFEVGRMNCRMLFLKRERFSELLILSSRLFHSITEDRKNEFLKKLCLTLNLVEVTMRMVRQQLLQLNMKLLVNNNINNMKIVI